jgi:hypothetical protein
MNTSMKKKLKLIMPIVLVVVIALGGVIAYIVGQNMANKPVPSTNSGISLEETPAYGACELVTTNTIKETFGGDKIISINEGVRVGEDAPNGTVGEGCSFSFSTQGSNSNSLTASVYDYTASSDGDTKEVAGADWAEVGGATPVAYFGQTTENQGAVTVYMYRVLPGNKNIMLTLRQLTDKTTYNRDDAFNFLGGIAATLNLSAVQNKTNSPDANTTPGAVTDTP